MRINPPTLAVNQGTSPSDGGRGGGPGQVGRGQRARPALECTFHLSAVYIPFAIPLVLIFSRRNGEKDKGSLTWTARHWVFLEGIDGRGQEMGNIIEKAKYHTKPIRLYCVNTTGPAGKQISLWRESPHPVLYSNLLQVTQVLVGYAGTRVAGAGELDKCPRCCRVAARTMYFITQL